MKNKKGIVILVLLLAILVASGIYLGKLLNTKEKESVKIESEITKKSEDFLVKKLDGMHENYNNLIDANISNIDEETISKYDIYAILDEENMILNVNQIIEYTNTENEDLNKLQLNVFTNAFKNEETSPTTLSSLSYAYPNGFNAGYTDLKSIKVDGEEVMFEISGIDETTLTINLSNSIKMLESAKLELVYDVKIPNCRDRFGYDDKTIQIANWYPVLSVYEDGQWFENRYYSIGDPFYSETSSYKVKINVPNEYIVAATGIKEDIVYDDSRKIYTMSSDFTRDFAIVMSKYFAIETRVVDGTRISTYTYTDDGDSENEALETGDRTITSFNEMFGKYPYSDLAIVETSFPSGMEYPQLIMIGNTYYQNGSEESLDGVVNHEIGHQWWYSLVGNNQVTESWLDEGLTSYSESLYYEYFDRGSYNNAVDNIKSIVNSGDKRYEDLVVAKPLEEFSDWNDYGYLAYRKSQMFFVDYREKYGEEKLKEALKLHFEKNKFAVTTTEDIVETFENVAGEDISDITNRALYGEIN